MGCSAQWLHCLLIWLFGIVEFYCAQKFLTVDDESCTSQPFKMQLKSDEDATVILQYSNTSSINKPLECEVELTLCVTFYLRRYSPITLDISIISEKSCLYDLGIFTGNTSGNRAIATLDCQNRRHWTGQWPTLYLILRYKMQSVLEKDLFSIDSVKSVIKFDICRNCYQVPNFYNKETLLKTFYDYDVCVDDSYVVYESRKHSLSGFCGKITFNVKDRVPLCVRIYSEIISDVCQIVIKIDGQQVMDINQNIRTSWCLPWLLERKSVSFEINSKKGYLCVCSVQIKTNSSNKHSTSCPLQRTTTQVIPLDEWSSWSSDVDVDYSESKGVNVYKVIGGGIGLLIFFVLAYACCKTCVSGPNEDTSDQGNETARHGSTVTVPNPPEIRPYQSSYSRRSRPTSYSQTQSPASNRQSYSHRPHSIVLDTPSSQPLVSNRQSSRDISQDAPAYEDIAFYSRVPRDRDDSSRQSTPTTVQRRPLINNTNDSPNGEPPPPSYEDVCQNPIYYK